MAAASSWELHDGDPIAEGRTVLGQLGGGHVYDVYLVWDERRFAVMVAKLLRPDQVGRDSARESLRREIEALRRLSHPVVMRGFDADYDGPYPHILLEHLEGPPLRSILKAQRSIGIEQLLPLGVYLASALHYVAEEGMAHLDVKPANIIMGIPPRLIDFSVARSLEEAARIDDLIGTDAYMAPEQCDPGRLGPVGSPADVFGLGATLYHAVAGHVPFPKAIEADDEILDERFPQLVDVPAPLPAGTPRELEELLLRTLASDPAERPPVREVALALEPLVGALPQRTILTRRGWQMR
jgi:serine/threonine protein kinase